MYRSRWIICGVAALAVGVSEKPANAASKKGPLVTLQQAIATARRQHESFQIADEQLKQAQLSRSRAWAALLPSLRASGTFTHSDREISRNFGEGKVVLLRQNAFAGNLSASLVLFKGVAIPELMQAYHLSAAAEQTYRWTRKSLCFDVAKAYFAALAAQNLVSAAQRTLKSAKEHLAAAEARRSAGEALTIDVTRARIEVVSARGELVKAENASSSSIDYLATLIGLDPPITIERPSDTHVDKLKAEKTELIKREDLEAVKLQIAAAKKAVTGSWLDYFPSLSASWNYQATQNTGFSGDPTSWNIIFSLDWLLFDGGMRRANRHEMASKFRELQQRLHLLKRNVKLGIRQARRDLETARVNVATAGEQLKLAKENRSLVIERYRAGLGTSLDLVEADDALRKAEVSRVAEEFNLALASLDVLKALGFSPQDKTSEKR